MELFFPSKELRDICLKRISAQKNLGKMGSVELERLIAELDAFETADEAIEFYDGFIDKSSIDKLVLCHECIKLVVTSNHRVPRRTKEGNTDWSRVTKLKIEKIEGSNV